ncbi:unnamed protein product [Diatraea saccharalis]|uniref:FERM domain-containing protein n=1 Tax=Diatraea saccharalis TaxID=40085 RepID=A0A9N9RGH4_9NEOP|nr:unnamed protein product [Diatraea saccharalis]
MPIKVHVNITVEFAGIQCQIHYGDFQEDKHKPGLIENLNEYLPEQYSSSWGIEKKILKEFRRHHGLSQIEAKFLYTKTARDLPTYGVTFFLVKEKQKGKKKLVPRLLGINAESILRLDEVTKEILQVWPLTQVKTYHAGKTETFTLNFGDYSDKEYSVKTNDAHRIRDILQGYIDIIRKRMEANYNLNQTEHYAICEDNVQASRGHIMERIEHKPSKIVEESFVGPSQIFTYEPGRAIAQGTQIVTVQQLVINAKGNNQQTVLVGEVPMRKGMSLEFVRKLNRLNSNSVKIVTLLTEPNQANLSEAVNIFNSMDADMPSLIEGVNEAAEKETDEEAKKKLLNDLQELVDHMRALSDNINTNVNPEEAQDISKRIADLSIQMCCALDPRMKKRGEFCRRSRKSFIKDEKMDASLRRASCLVAAQHTTETIQQVKQHLDEEYQGPKLDPADVEELEKSAANKMAKLNAAVALNLMAYADTQNIDYAVAVTSMNTINELLPKLAKAIIDIEFLIDAKALASVKDGKDREAFLEAIQSLCDAVKLVCLAADPDDYQKMQNAVKDYGRASDKLLFTFRRGGNRNTDKEKEILDLSKEVAEKNKLLLDKSNELAGLVSEPEAAMLEDASGRCAQAARDIITCAELSAACIAEPHCRSALKASAENLSSSVQHLALTWRPMLERDDTKHLAPQLRDRTMDLAKALDKLKGAFAGMDDVPEEPDKRMVNQKVMFVKSVAAAKDKMNAAETEFNVPLTEVSKNETEEEIQNRLTQKLAQLNAALAALVTATAGNNNVLFKSRRSTNDVLCDTGKCFNIDRDKPDYETAELAINTIGELMPDIVRDGKLLSADKDVASREKMMNELKALCKATKNICDSTDNGNLNDVHGAASKFAASSGKLFYVFNPRARRDNEHKIADISSSVDEKASQLMAAVQDLSQRVDAEAAVDLEIAGSKAADAAAALHTAVSVTAPYIEDPRCQEALLSAIDSSSHANQNLSLAWMNLLKNPRYKDLGDSLDEKRLQLERELDRLRKACRDIGAARRASAERSLDAGRRHVLVGTYLHGSLAAHFVRFELDFLP